MRDAYVQVYTGDGKGKTTAALGLALRALGAGLNVFIGQFIKGMRYSEIAMLESLTASLGPERFSVRQYGRGCFILRAPEEADLAAARGGLEAIRTEMASGRWDLIILDEANVALSLGLIDEDSVLGFLKARPKGVELVFTGRGAPASLVAAADLVTEMRCVRHYYEAGVEAREGIER